MSPLVLITGANGFIGSAVALGALQDGLRVRAAVRRAEAATLLEKTAAFESFVTNKTFETVIIPDMTVEDAFLDAAQDCDYIIHVASPIPKFPFDQDFEVMRKYPSLATTAVLKAAETTQSVRRVVFTSSIHAIQTLENTLLQTPVTEARMKGDFSTSQTLSADAVIHVPDRPPVSDVVMDFYQAGKIESRNTALNYIRDHPDATFSVVILLPGYVFGENPVARNRLEFADGTNIYLSFIFSDFRVPTWAIGAEIIHIDDVVEAHIKAMTVRPEAAVQNYLLCTDGPHGPIVESAVDILKEDAPEMAAKMSFAGYLGTIPSKFDIGSTETVLLGRPMTGFRKIVVDYAKAYLALPE